MVIFMGWEEIISHRLVTDLAMHIRTSYRHTHTHSLSCYFQKEEDRVAVAVQSLYSFPVRKEKLLMLTVQKEKKQAMPTTFNHS